MDFAKEVDFGFSARDRYFALSKVVKRTDRATVLLVDVEKDEDRGEEHEGEKMTKLLEAKYPDFRLGLRRGDIIENIKESGYRSDGVYFYDGRSIINLDTDWDDYGSIPFVVFEEFAPDYWVVSGWGDHRQTDLNIDSRYVQRESVFWWHQEDGAFRLNPEKIGRIIEGGKTEINFRGKTYRLIGFEFEEEEINPIDTSMRNGSCSANHPDTVTVY